jgi:transposase
VFLKAVRKKDGATFWYLARSRRQDRRIGTEYLWSFGQLRDDQVEHLRTWLALLSEGPDAIGRVLAVFQSVKSLRSLDHGIVAAVHAIFRTLGLRTLLLEAFAGVPRKGLLVNMVEVMVANRLDSPSSKLAIATDWFPRTSLPFLLPNGDEPWTEDHLYAALDALDLRRDRLERRLYERIVRPLGGPGGILLNDLSSTYFEGDEEGNTLAEYGYSRDHRPDRKQVVFGLVLTPQGFPITLEVYQGNTKDETTLEGTLERLHRLFGIRGGTFVGDRGLVTEENLKRLHRAGFRYVMAERAWNEKEVLAAAREKRLAPFPKRRGEGWCEVIDREGGRHIAVYSEAKEIEQLATLDRRISEAQDIETWGRRRVKRALETAEGHHELLREVSSRLIASGADLLYDVAWDPNSTTGLSLRKNEKRRAWEEEAAGWWLLSTDTELPGDQVVTLYKSLARAEGAFRDLKGPLQLRPVRHWRAWRVRGHLQLCALSYLVEQWVEQKVRSAGGRWTEVTGVAALQKLRSIRLELLGVPGMPAMRKWAVTELSAEERDVTELLGITNDVSEFPKGLV